ncbi:hypothetical protein N431DRAFT_454588 [Stipitochalara longipes BDJ]|nr:hypothetical protein N431DRAFT_454588 [Stipitochalara longipes BDJ]
MAFSLLNTFLLACSAFGFTNVQAQSGPLLQTGRLAASPGPGSSFLPVVIYQSSNSLNSLFEVHATSNGGWNYGSLGDAGAFLPQAGTPLTSVLYPSTGQIYLYYVSIDSELIERVRSNTGVWSAPRYMGVNPISSGRGLTSYLDPTGQITIWYQDTDSTIKRCLWRSAGCLAEDNGGPSINNVLLGSDIASFQDDVGHQHIYYQTKDAGNPIKEMAWDKNQWNFGPLIENAPPQVSFKSIMSAISPGNPSYSSPISQFWQLNTQIFNQVTMAVFDATECGGWCYAKSLMQTLEYTAGLSVTSSGTAVRAYFITSAGTLGELGNNANGWGMLPDILAVAT